METRKLLARVIRFESGALTSTLSRTLCVFLLVFLASSTTTAVTRLTYVGHASFEWVTSGGKKIIIDPYGNSLWVHWFDQQFPPLDADVVLVTHQHFDHDAVNRVAGQPLIMDHEGVVEGVGYYIQGITGHHARSEKYGSNNLIFLLEIDGVRFCHWGDNDAEISEGVLQKLGRVDVLLLPVDESEHLLTTTEVTNVIERLSPKVVIPTHYFNAGLTSPCSTLQAIDRWLSRQSRVRRIPSKGVELSLDTLPSAREVWVFDRADASVSMPNSAYKALPCVMQITGVWLTGLALSAIAFTGVWFVYRRKKS